MKGLLILHCGCTEIWKYEGYFDGMGPFCCTVSTLSLVDRYNYKEAILLGVLVSVRSIRACFLSLQVSRVACCAGPKHVQFACLIKWHAPQQELETDIPGHLSLVLRICEVSSIVNIRLVDRVADESKDED